MALFTRSQPTPNDQLEQLQKQVSEQRRELDAMRRDLESVDLHARAIVEEAKRMINKFERRLDREAADKPVEDAPGRANGTQPYLGPSSSSRRNY